MKLKDEETKQERIDRLTVIDKERNQFIARALPILCIILVVMIVMLIVMNKKDSEKNIGNPYECMVCKELARACKEHKNFNHDEELKETIYTNVYYYKYAEESDETYAYYTYGESYYNLDCDFCSSNKVECNGCKYTRQAILEYTRDILDDETISRFCSDCRELGYPYCNADVTFITEKVYESIKK